MPQQRIKGQNTIITIIADGDLQARIDAIKDTEVVFDFELLEEGYIGETANRFDAIFNGVTFNATGHLTNKQFIDLTKAVLQKAQQRGGGVTRIDVATTLVFPNGDLVNFGIPDIELGSIPFNTGSRKDYIEWKIEGKSGEIEIF